jgi:hypothetical protein
MAIQLSPGVQVSEVDLTTVVPSVLTTAGAFAGYFPWGPVNKITLVDSEITLVKRFTAQGPDSNSAISFFTCANFLAYGNNLSVVRTVGANCYNAVANTSNGPLQIQNSDTYQYTYLYGNAANTFGTAAARYPGSIGNALAVGVCANTSLFSTWAYSSYFPSAPGTSQFVAQEGGSNDEMHIVVIDATGEISGSAGTVLETYPFVSKALDAINLNNGSSNWFKQVILNQSKYILPGNLGSGWSVSGVGTTFSSLTSNIYNTLSGGTDDIGTDATTETGYALFENKENVDINLVLTGGADVTLQQFVIDNIATQRADCVAVISPPANAVINQAGAETTNIQNWLSILARTSSYAVADSGWKYQFDKYNNVYRWIPLNGDIAGLCVNTDAVADPWFSPAGFNRGNIKNAVKLAWNPTKTQRDTLYNAGVNPVVSFPGKGIVLFGDKTLQNKPSAFDRINVRRLFIVLEKAISKAAQASLFEFNDSFTQAQFVSMVTPFLRDVQGRRGITDFKVVCDSTNNTQQVIDSNQFVGDIYIKPARSINFIQLNFIAVGTGVDFTTVVGAV